MVVEPKRKSLYRNIYDAIRDEILSEAFPGGSFLPSERELCTRFGVDRITVRRSLDMLVEEGLVEKKAGIGTQVRTRPVKAEPRSDKRNILFVLPNSPNQVDRITESFNVMLFHGIEKECSARGFSLVYSTLAPEEEFAGISSGNNIHGVILISRFTDRQYDDCRRTEIPCIVINHSRDDFLCINSDNERGAHEAVSHLVRLQHERIGILLGTIGTIAMDERYRGYVRALAEAGIDVGRQAQETGDWTFHKGLDAMKTMLQTVRPLPTAIFAQNDMMAIGALEAIRAEGLTIPGDISVIGFDNVEQCEYSQPRLTTVRVDIDLFARTATGLLFDFIDTGVRCVFRIIIPTQLVQRSSTGPRRPSPGARTSR